jgi:hypothetical protein
LRDLKSAPVPGRPRALHSPPRSSPLPGSVGAASVFHCKPLFRFVLEREIRYPSETAAWPERTARDRDRLIDAGRLPHAREHWSGKSTRSSRASDIGAATGMLGFRLARFSHRPRALSSRAARVPGLAPRSPRASLVVPSFPHPRALPAHPVTSRIALARPSRGPHEFDRPWRWARAVLACLPEDASEVCPRALFSRSFSALARRATRSALGWFFCW